MRNTLEAILLSGTIISCPSCGEGLYKVGARCTTEDVVLDDGTLLVPLNLTIPARDAWTSLSCPKCGARLFKDGKIHTLQQGWL